MKLNDHLLIQIMTISNHCLLYTIIESPYEDEDKTSFVFWYSH